MSVEPSNAPRLPAVGEVLVGRFHLREVIGEGGMGQVYRAYDEAAGREVAIKLLIVRYLGRPEREARMLREAELGRRVKHPNLVTYLDSGRLGEHGWPFIVSELVRGNDLGLKLALKPISIRLVARIARQLAGALRALHAAGVVHRDVTSSNVLLDGSHATLIDLSHAGDLTQPKVAAGQPGRLTRLHEVPGTHLYMSREQANANPADPSMDVFAYGVTLIHMLTGVPPDGYGREEYIEMQRRGMLESPRIDPSACPTAPLPFVELANACVETEAAKRPTMAEVVERLERLMAAMVMPAESTQQILAANDEGIAVREPDAPWVLRRSKLQAAGAPPVIDADAHSKPSANAPVEHATSAAAAPQDRANVQRKVIAVLAVLLVGSLAAVLALSVMLSRDGGQGSEAASVSPPPSDSDDPTAFEPRVTPEPTATSDARPATDHEIASGDSTGTAPETGDTTPSTAQSASTGAEVEPLPAPSPPKPAGPVCDGTEAKVERAVREQDWRQVLRLTRSTACWPNRTLRARHRVQAFLQLHRWEECIALAKNIDDADMKRAASNCSAALEASKP